MQSNLSYILFFCCLFFTKPGFSQDLNSLKKTGGLQMQNDSIPAGKIFSPTAIKQDSLLFKKKDTIALDSLQPKEAIQDIIVHTAKDYTIQNAKNKTITLYNEAHVTYTDIDLKAGIIIVDYTKNTLFAKGIKDSLGYSQIPVFKQGSEETEQDSMVYNFKSKKALIYGLKTKQGEMFTFGKKNKKSK